MVAGGIMGTSPTDRIEKSIQLRHAPSRVWQSLTDFKEFGSWFGVVLSGPFEPGARLKGRVTHKGYEHMTMEIEIERMEPERFLSWRWHPGAAEPGESFSHEPPTVVEFELREVPGGTLLTVVESGFDQLPLARRAKAFRDNSEGWAAQMGAIERHLG
jgi:uncharacterized protein YndB with AHSA1/START domain